VFKVEMTCTDCATRRPNAVHGDAWWLSDPITREPRSFVTRWEAQVAGHAEALINSLPAHQLGYELVESSSH